MLWLLDYYEAFSDRNRGRPAQFIVDWCLVIVLWPLVAIVTAKSLEFGFPWDSCPRFIRQCQPVDE